LRRNARLEVSDRGRRSTPFPISIGIQKSGARVGRASDLPGIDRLWYDYLMNKYDIIARLKENEAALRAQGVAHAALFGSVARGDQRPDSDIDIMIELDPTARVTMFDYVDIKEYIEGLFQGPVDVVNLDGLKPFVRPRAAADAIYAF
jgi:predicted nucleotidyltransferase